MTQEPNSTGDAETTDDEVLEEPSTEKSPDEEPRAAHAGETEPSHEAVGIGIVGRPQTGTDESDSAALPDTTNDSDVPVDNPSGG